MNEPSTSARVPWLLIIGMVMGGGLLVVMTWDSLSGKTKSDGKNQASSSVHVVEFTLANWQKEVLESDVPVLVDFTAKWCGPCQTFAPVINNLADRFQGRVKVGKFNAGDKGIENLSKLPAQYRQFDGIPHVTIFKRGEIQFERSGGAPPAQLGSVEEELAKVLDGLLQ